MKQIMRNGGMEALENVKRPITPAKFHRYKHLHGDSPVDPFS